MIKQFIVIIVILLSFNSYSQLVTILDNSNLQPLKGVRVRNLKTGDFKITDTKGHADISTFADSDSIEFRAVGYITKIVSYNELKTFKFIFYMSEKTYSFDEVVISANKTEEEIKDLAQEVHVMKSKELAFMNQQTTADVMQNTGKVMVQKSQLGGGSPVIRGFETNKVLIVIDGVRMNNAIYRGGHLQNVISLDNTIMDKVEVVFGPGSVIYGSDALGGVMHFYTKNPILADSTRTIVKANAFSRYSTAYKEFTEHFDISVGGKRFASLTSANYSKFGDLMQGNNRNPFYGDWGKRLWYADRINGKDSMLINENYNLQRQSGYLQYDFLQKFLFKQNENTSHILNFQYSTSSNVNRYDRLTVLSGNKPKFAEWYYGPQERLFASYTLEHKRTKGFYDNSHITVAFQQIEESRNDRRFGKTDLNHQIENVDVITFNTDFSKQIKKHELRYGLESWYNDVNSKAKMENIETGEISSLETRYPDGGSQMYSFATYLSHAWEISEKLILNDGIRVNNVRLNANFIDTTFFPFPFNSVEQNNTAVTGNIGLVYMPGNDWRFTISAASGFRAPNVDDLSKVFESTIGSVIVPNPDIKPENTYNGEVGISKVFMDKTTIGVNSFYTLYKDAITTQPGTFNGADSILYRGELSQVMMSTNAAEAFIYGFSGMLNIQVTDHFSISNTVNYTYGRIKTDTTDYPLDHIPPVFGKTSFVLSMNKFRGEFFVMYNGAKRSVDYNLQGEDNHINSADPVNGFMPAWMTLNVRTAYQFNKYIQLQLALENILDQNYRVFASNISAPGRNFVVTLRGTL